MVMSCKEKGAQMEEPIGKLFCYLWTRALDLLQKLIMNRAISAKHERRVAEQSTKLGIPEQSKTREMPYEMSTL